MAHTQPADPAGARTESRARETLEAMTERHLGLLKELAEIGMDLARLMRQQAEAEPERAAGLAAGFAQVAKAVRQTVALEAKLADGRDARTEEAALDERWRLGDAAQDKQDRRRHRVMRAVEKAIEIEARESDAEDLLADLDERLDDPDIRMDLEDRPIGEIVMRICKDLGIAPDPRWWADEDWAIAERQAAEAKAAKPSNPPATIHRLAGTGIVRPPAPRIEDS